jgi:hypothetical protein
MQAAKIQERILQLEKEAPKTPAAKAPTPAVGNTTGVAKSVVKAPATSTAKSTTKSAPKPVTRTTKSGSATKRK